MDSKMKFVSKLKYEEGVLKLENSNFKPKSYKIRHKKLSSRLKYEEKRSNSMGIAKILKLSPE